MALIALQWVATDTITAELPIIAGIVVAAFGAPCREDHAMSLSISATASARTMNGIKRPHSGS